MPIILFLVFLLFYTSPSALAAREDETSLLKIKEQLGNPGILSSWVEGFDYCEHVAMMGTSIVYTACTETGRVFSIRFKNLDFGASFPDAICGLTELNSLEIYTFTGLHGPIPSCITKLRNLGLFVIQETSLSGPVPNFSNNPNLKVITLSNNQFTGHIPRSFSTLSNLVSLDLSSNHLDGTILPGIVPGGWAMLILSNNNLTGEIPESYGSDDLWIINVGNNNLHGDASFLFGKQKIAVNIGLANNNFKFNLSRVEISDRLYILNLSRNKIFGNVPPSFATANNLQVANLSFNKLCGELPKGGNMARFGADVFANNTCLCGYPLPPCLSSPPPKHPPKPPKSPPVNMPPAPMVAPVYAPYAAPTPTVIPPSDVPPTYMPPTPASVSPAPSPTTYT